MKKAFFILMVVGMVIAMSSCEKEEVKPLMSIKNNEISIHHDGTEKLIVENAEGDITYSSENKLIADVSDDGIVTGRVKGSTKITVTAGGESATCKVEVKTLINFIPEPYQGFGEGYETVKNKIKDDGELIENDGSLGVMRTIDGTKFIYLYSFEGGKLESSGFVFSTLSKTLSSMMDFLLERYVPVTQTGTYSYAFISPDKKTAVYIKLSDDLELMYVIYFPYTETKSASAVYSIPENCKEMVKGLLH